MLELAFSVLYESDEYLNFIAPDKHEVSQQWQHPAAVYSVRENEHVWSQKESFFLYFKSIVYKASVQVRYVLDM